MTDLTRRFVLGQSITALTLFSGSALARTAYETGDNFMKESFEPERPVTAITLGAGNRGSIYGYYSHLNPHQINIVGVAEPIKERKEKYGQFFNIDDENRFDTWEHVFDRPKFADAIIITTPDHLHYGPFMRAAEMGYDILLEKPMAQSIKECEEMRDIANKTGVMVGVCHVLRYSPYFRELKSVAESGAFEKLVSIEHREPIQHVHMAHSFVRGIWNRSETSTPIIVAKSCHDMDILQWLVNEPCESVSAMGDLAWFKEENAPEGSTARCLDGCAVVDTCPYSAPNIYVRDKEHLGHLIGLGDPTGKEQEIYEKVRTSRYGRCVYRCDNNQPDHFIAALQFEGGITAGFSMQGLTSTYGRRTRMMGSMADLEGDEDKFTLTDYSTGKATHYETPKGLSGHGGGDFGLMYDFVRAVSLRKPEILPTDINESMESHAMSYAAEKSRVKGKRLKVH